MQWLRDNWTDALFITALASSIANHVSQHWTEVKGRPVRKIAYLLTELLSFFASRDVTTRVGMLKLPLTSVAPRPPEEPKKPPAPDDITDEVPTVDIKGEG